MSASGLPDPADHRPRGPAFVSIPIQTLADARGISPESYPGDRFSSVKGALQVGRDKYRIATVEISSVETPFKLRADECPDDWGFAVPVFKPQDEQWSAMELVDKLYRNNATTTIPFTLSCALFHLHCPVSWLLPPGFTDLRSIHIKRLGDADFPGLVWSPAHLSHADLPAIKAACIDLAVFAPSYTELLAMFGRTGEFEEVALRLEGEERLETGREMIEKCAAEILDLGEEERRLWRVVVEAGEWGCVVGELDRWSVAKFRWHPAVTVASETPFGDVVEVFVGAVGWRVVSPSRGCDDSGTGDAMVAAAFATCEGWGLVDAMTFARRRRKYGEVDLVREIKRLKAKDKSEA